MADTEADAEATANSETDEGKAAAGQSHGADEQTTPGEPIDGPTRDELRAELRALGLPVSGTKEQLQDRLDEARGDQGGIRNRIADGLEKTAERVRGKGTRSRTKRLSPSWPRGLVVAVVTTGRKLRDRAWRR